MIVMVANDKKNEKLKIFEFGTPSPQGFRGRSWGPGVREYYMLHIILSGEGFFNAHHLKAGQYFLARPYEKINYFPKKSNPWNYLWILFNGEEAEELLSSCGLFPQDGVGNFNGVEEVKQVVNNFFSQDVSTIDSETGINLAKLIFSFNKNKKEAIKGGIKQKHLVKATEYIQSKYHEGITPSLVAEFVGLDEKYLYSLFKKFLGVSMQEYLTNLRIEKAKILLEKSELNISEVAYSVGIEDPLHFSRCFKGKVGESPRNYREQLKKKLVNKTAKVPV